MSSLQEKYRRAFSALLPDGDAWDAKEIPETNLYKLINSFAANWNALDCRSQDLILEMFPQTMCESLSEWESEYGLPDPCSGQLGSIEERKVAVLAKFIEIGGQDKDYYISVAAALGIEIEITEFIYFRAGVGRMLDQIVSPPNALKWQVEVIGSETILFTSGASSTGDSLASNDTVALLQCIFARIKPAHTEIIYIL